MNAPMGHPTIVSPDAVRPPFELLDGCLTVATQSEEEFLAGFEEHFWVLMHSERSDLVVDFAYAKGLDITAYQMVALNLFEINPTKQLTLRIPEKLAKLFKQSKLYRKVEVEVVRFLGQERDVTEAQADESSDELQEKSQQVSHLISQMEALPSDSQEVSVLAAQARETMGQLRSSSSAAIPRVSSPSRLATSPPAGSERVFAGDAAAGGTDDPLSRVGQGELLDTRTGAVRPLPADDHPFYIGRVPDNELQVASPLISRRHSRIARRGDRYEITDLGSGNGTYVNGKRLEPNQAKTLFHGDRIALAVTRQFPQGAKVYVFHQADA